MKRKYIFAAILAVSLAGFFYLLFSFDINEVWSLLADANLWYLASFVITALFMLAGFTLTWKQFINAQNIQIPFGALFNFRMAGFAVSYVTPGPRVGGEVIRANMAKEYGAFSDFVASSIMEKICIFFASIVLVISALLLAPFLFPSVSWYLFLGSVVVLLTGSGVVWWHYHNNQSLLQNILNFLKTVGLIPDEYREDIDGFVEKIERFFTDDKYHFLSGLVIALGCKLLLVVQFFFLLQMLGFSATILEAFLLAAAIEVAYAIPGYMGIGFLEAGQAGVLALVSLPANVGVITALLIRGRDLLASAYGFLALSYYSSRDGL